MATDPPKVEEAPVLELCAWCFGSGKYLEAMDCGVDHVYLPVVCAGCNGSGKR